MESGCGLGLFSVLGIVFIVLKLTGNIGWPWIWVLAPFWIPLALALVGLIILILINSLSGNSYR